MRILAVLRVLLAAGLLLPGVEGRSQDRPAYQFLRAEEDWRALRDPSLRTEPLDGLKAIPLSPSATLAFGGDLRLRYEGYDPVDLGFGSAGDNGYLLTRLRLHTDLRVEPWGRAFVELTYGGVSGEAFPLSPLQDNDPDIAQAFAETSTRFQSGRLSLRAGRQEMLLGSGRLVNPRDGPNTRLTFDGARLTWSGADGAKLDAFYTRPVQPRRGVFDDQSGEAFAFWGAYGVMPLPGADRLSLDFYYLGSEREELAFAQARVDERRNTLGVRLAGRQGRWDWDSEAAFQFGTSTAGDIRGYALANDVGYTFDHLPWSPRVGLRLDLVSGDKNLNDRKIGNFQIPFPKLPYLVEASFVTPANIVDVHPGITVSPRPDLKVTAGYIAVWKHREADAFYLPPLRPVPGTAGAGGFATHLVQVKATWSPTASSDVDLVYVHARPSDALERTGARTSNFLMLSNSVRF